MSQVEIHCGSLNPSVKRPYVKPRLVVLGSFEDITRGSYGTQVLIDQVFNGKPPFEMGCDPS
jgi:hypothetical protein